MNDTFRRDYAAQRGVSQGASITLMAVCGGYRARYACAEKAVLILGDRNYSAEPVPSLLIPMADVHLSIKKLAETFSVALVDTVTEETTTRFVLVWKILPRVPDTVAEPQPDANQGNFNLDEY